MFVLSGIVFNLHTRRQFLTGTMFGESDILFNRLRKYTFIADEFS